jgi:hypothetical protein
MPPSYLTRQRDGLMLPRRDTFLNAYKILSMSLLPSKTKETTFQVLNRTIWTQNKAFKSGMAAEATCFTASDVMKQRLWSTSSLDVKTTQQRSGLWLDGCSLFLSRDTLETSFLGLTSPLWKLSSTSHTHQFFSMFLTAPLEKSSFYFSRKLRETSSSAELSLLSLDVERNFTPEFKHIFCQ